MTRRRLVKIEVHGKYYDALLDEDTKVLYSVQGVKGKPSHRQPSDQIQTKTLQKLAALYYILKEARLNPEHTDLSILMDITQDLLHCTRLTARDYVKTIYAIHLWGPIPHPAKVIETT